MNLPIQCGCVLYSQPEVEEYFRKKKLLYDRLTAIGVSEGFTVHHDSITVKCRPDQEEQVRQIFKEIFGE